MDLNTAAYEELITLSNIGEVRATTVVAVREKIGRSLTLLDLTLDCGISGDIVKHLVESGEIQSVPRHEDSDKSEQAATLLMSISESIQTLSEAVDKVNNRQTLFESVLKAAGVNVSGASDAHPISQIDTKHIYKHIYSSFQQLYQRWCCLIIILKCTLTAKFVKCYPLKYCCPLIINNDILVLCDLAHFMNSLISFPLISFTTFSNDLIFMTLYLIVSHSSRINATNCNFFLVLSEYVEVIYSITTSMQKLQYYSTDYLGGGQSICMLLALLTGAVS